VVLIERQKGNQTLMY